MLYCVAMILSKYNEPNCRLHLAQKDLKLAINLSESVDQPMHVGAAVNEVCLCGVDLNVLKFILLLSIKVERLKHLASCASRAGWI